MRHACRLTRQARKKLKPGASKTGYGGVKLRKALPGEAVSLPFQGLSIGGIML
jgi:hypothetical protein